MTKEEAKSTTISQDERKLKAQIAQCKGSLTKAENFLRKQQEGPLDKEAVDTRLQQLTGVLASHKDLTVQLHLLHEESADTDFSNDDFEDRCLAVTSNLCKLLHAAPQQRPEAGGGTSATKLPDIDIPVFDGKDFTKYNTFIELFNAIIDNNNRLAPIQKLFYLRKFTKGEPLSLIEGLPITGDSYPKSLELLSNRYDNKFLVITNHVQALLDFPTISKGASSNLRELVSNSRQHLAALETLGQSPKHWDMLLLPILLRKVDQYTCRAYHSERVAKDLPMLEDFFTFLERRACSFEVSQHSEGKSHSNFNKSKVTNFASKTAAPGPSCKFCNASTHKLFKCDKFQALPVGERAEFVSTNSLCKLCLNPHKNKCQFHFKCEQCKSKMHNTLLHGIDELKVSMHSNSFTSTVLLPTIKAKILSQDGKSYTIAKGLVDSGSQVSFVTTALANSLKLKPFNNNLNITALGKQTKSTSKAVNVNFMSLQTDFKCQVTCSIIDQITTSLPQHKVNMQNVNIPEFINLADDEFDTPGQIAFLLSADVFFKILLPNKTKLQDSNLYVIDTEFGSILSGEIQNNEPHFNSHPVTLHAVVSDNDDSVSHLLQKFWETEMVPGTKMEVTAKQVSCEAEFRASVQLVNGKFQVPLPLQCPPDQANLGSTYYVASKSLQGLQKRFAKDKGLKQGYFDFMNDYVALGHAKILTLNKENIHSSYFMLHHPVIRNDKKTTRLRVVFNGNTRASSNHNSLNDMLLNGPNNQNDLFNILVLFRTHKYVLLADIKHMYRAINIDPAFRKLQNILWTDEDGTDKILQLQTVTYGLKNSSYLATQCLRELAEGYAVTMPNAAKVIQTSMYVDDSLFGANTIEEALQVRDEFISLLNIASFQLHKWAANHPALLAGIPADKQHFNERELTQKNLSMKALGVSYDISNDQFKITRPTCEPTKWNKRSVLSFIGSFFDPLGLAAPVILKAKQFMQRLWLENLEWDSPLSQEFLKDWLKFYHCLNSMPVLCVNRYLNIHNANSVQIFGFCDASAGAIGAVIYIKVINNGIATFTLLCAKSRVAPIKNRLTIPKLELNAALLLAQLYSKVAPILSAIRVDNIYLFSDSQVTLCWLTSARTNLPAFVKNRVNMINQLTTDCKWCHIPGSQNPADCLSRGCDPQQLLSNDLWWNGPEHLRHTDYRPLTMPTCAHVTCMLSAGTDRQSDEYCEGEEIFNKFSSFGKLVRVVAWAKRFIYNCIHTIKRSGYLTIEELQNSSNKIMSQIQLKYFAEDISRIKENKDVKSNLKTLNPFIDGNGVLRVGGRLQNAQIPYSQKHPIILPSKCHVTQLIIKNEHIALLHSGLALTVSKLRLKFWIIGVSREAKRVINKCIKCYRFKAQGASQLMGSLPSDRVTESHPFSKVGVDYCGPFQVKQSSLRRSVVTKGYTLVFVCFATKAINLELVSDMTTQSFLAALKRFIARRGVPQVIHCDNGQSFKGANNTLHDLYLLNKKDCHQNSVVKVAADKGIEFKFIPSYSPTFGGLWESAVKNYKYHFKRVVGASIFTYEELNTILIEIEGVLNSRPLTPLSRDPTDLSTLTPGHFLIGRSITCIPEADLTEIPSNRLKFWRRCTQIKQHFWHAWHKQYLSQLNSRPKWHKTLPDIEDGSLVLLKGDNVPPLQWPMARVIKVFRGQDQKVRVAELKTATGITRRSINKLCVLPLM